MTGLDAGDGFGRSVALSNDSTVLVVGADQEDGLNNHRSAAGSFWGFNFTDGNFSGGSQVLQTGYGYAGNSYSNLSELVLADFLGSSVALDADGDRLAIGAIGDGGANDDTGYSGAVHLYSFSDTAFSGGTLEGSIGKDYTGGKNVDVSSLDMQDMFGYSLALDGDGDRLAVGALRDDGATNDDAQSGAVLLFSFTDTSFTGGSLTATIGRGYSGTKDLGLSDLDDYDYFGSAVALNDNGTHLAVGAFGDDGADDDASEAGALWLISFTNSDFAGASADGRIGVDYTGTGNLSPSGLAAGDQLGYSLSLDGDGNRMAAGLPGDDGSAGSSSNAGAVYLISFSDTDFSSPTRSAIIGSGYSGSKDVSPSGLAAGDQLGSAVALDGDADRLAIGEITDDGNNDALTDAGLVRLYSFSDLDFSSGSLAARFGFDYTSGSDLHLPSLDSGDHFGTSLALDETGSLMAAGASTDDGWLNGSVNIGAVYLFRGEHLSGSHAARGNAYASHGSESTALNALQIADLLSRGNNLTLQASNDITLSNAITVAQGAGTPGSLTLQAGRSILVNASISTAGGGITLIGNDLLANGVIDGDREAGNAVISMAAAAALNAGSGAVSLDLRAGTGKTNTASGDITLSDITAGTVTIVNDGPSSGSGITLRSGKIITASASGDAIVLAADDFTNSSSGSALTTSHSDGRWLVWTADPDDDSAGDLSPDFYQFNSVYGTDSVSGGSAEDGFVYSRAVTLTPSLSDSAAQSASKAYDGTRTASVAASDLAISGKMGNETVTLASTASLFDNANAGTGKTITVSGISISSVASNSKSIYGYQLASNSVTNNNASITAKALQVSGTSAADKIYDGTTSASLTLGSLSGLVGNQTLTLTGTGSFADAQAGTGKSVSVAYSLSDGTGLASNYSLADESVLASILPVAGPADPARPINLTSLMRTQSLIVPASSPAARPAVPIRLAAIQPAALIASPPLLQPAAAAATDRFVRPSEPVNNLQQKSDQPARIDKPDGGRPTGDTGNQDSQSRSDILDTRSSQPVQSAAPSQPATGQQTSGQQTSGQQTGGQKTGPVSWGARPGRICVEDGLGNAICTLP